MAAVTTADVEDAGSLERDGQMPIQALRELAIALGDHEPPAGIEPVPPAADFALRIDRLNSANLCVDLMFPHGLLRNRSFCTPSSQGDDPVSRRGQRDVIGRDPRHGVDDLVHDLVDEAAVVALRHHPKSPARCPRGG